MDSMSVSDLLMRALYEEDVNTIQYCLGKGAMNFNRICRNGMTHLGAAAQTGNLHILQMLLENSQNTVSDSDVQNCNSTRSGSGMLHLDVALGRRQNMGYFVVCKDMEENDLGEGPTPDGMEALEWDVEITEDNVKEEEEFCPEINLYKWYAKILNQTSIILKSPDNDIARLDGHGRNILHYAVLSGSREMVDYLLSNYSEFSVNQSDSKWYSPLHISVMTGSVRMTEFLLIKNANINSVNRDRQTPLHLAAQCGFCDIIVMLLDYGANVNSFDIDERSPLTLAIAYYKEDAARMLIKKGTRLNHEETFFEGYTPIYRAVLNDLTGTVKLLMDYGAKIIHSHYLLHVAAGRGNLEIVKTLVKAGAVVNMRNQEGMTPLMVACSSNYLHIAKYLLKNGASANTPNHLNGFTPLHICVQDLISDTTLLQQFIDTLISYGADINATSAESTPLFYSIIIGNFDAACLLIKHGTDVNVREDRAYIDYLSLAKRHGNLQVVKMLLYAGFSLRTSLLDLRYGVRKGGEDEIHEFLVKMWSTPMNLRELCRVTIRRSLGSQLMSKIHQLPLPTMLHQYLALDIL